MNKLSICALLLFTASIFSCSKDSKIPDEDIIQLAIPKGFPNVDLPENNQLTNAKISLGKELFYEKLFARDSSLSCGSCHMQEFAFTDALQNSRGIDNQIGIRNSLPLFNLAWKKQFFRDGGVQILELVALNSINAHNEFDINTEILVQRLQANSKYVQLFRTAFNDTISLNKTLFALASFQRTLISGQSNYDKYTYYNNSNALTASQVRGKDLFFSSKTDCSSCHGGFNFSNESIQSNGYFSVYPDSGRQRITLSEHDRGKFVVPSLRNISVTGPYMHNGSVQTLEEIIDNYNNGNTDFVNKNSLIRPLGLSPQEKQDLVAFLDALTDLSFLHNQAFKP
jgi:cytochrome c peroxidase